MLRNRCILTPNNVLWLFEHWLITAVYFKHCKNTLAKSNLNPLIFIKFDKIFTLTARQKYIKNIAVRQTHRTETVLNALFHTNLFRTEIIHLNLTVAGKYSNI